MQFTKLLANDINGMGQMAKPRHRNILTLLSDSYMPKNMQSKEPHYLSKVTRSSPRKLVDRGDSGLQWDSGDSVDLHTLLTQNSVQVRLVKVVTNAMRPSGLHPGGIALVYRGRPTKEGQVAHVRYNAHEVIRRLIRRAGQWFLVADDPRIGELLITKDDIVEKLGVVTAGIVLL